MDTTIAQKWIEMLESGNYPQTRQKLYTDNGYCCLGVLCELYKRETGNGEWVPCDIPYYESSKVYAFKTEKTQKNSTDTLPDEVKDWAGMTSACGVFIEEELPAEKTRMLDDAFGRDRPLSIMTLAEYNDYSCYSFADIAKIIKIVKEEL
jgi:hypothetical protein